MARGFEEVEEVEKDSPTVSKSTMRILMSVAVSKGWTVKSTDIKSAFLQGKEIQREMCTSNLHVKQNTCWKIMETEEDSLWIKYAARKFYDSIREELKNLALVQSKVDPSLFYKVNNGELISASITHIDDFMHCGSALFDNIVIKSLLERFIPRKEESDKFCYIDFGINQNHKEITKKWALGHMIHVKLI